jgi:hypothetical protein
MKEPECTSKIFGPKFYCFYGTTTHCRYCGSEKAPLTQAQNDAVDAVGRLIESLRTAH